MDIFTGIFYILHGFVHLLYMGHSFNYFELEQGFVWPDHARLLGRFFSLQTKKRIAGILCILAAVGFVASGVFVMTGHSLEKQSVITAIIISTFLFLAFWDGRKRKWHTQGGIALLINLLILVYTLTLA